MEGDNNPATTKRKFSEDSVSSSDDDLQLLKRAKGLAAERSSSVTNDRNPDTTSGKIKYTEVAARSDDGLRKSKRLAVPERRTNIDDIPKELLVEILCRLACAKSINRCKCVSKTWLSFTSDPYFIGRVLLHNQTLLKPAGAFLNNSWGDKLLTTNLFARFARFKKEENLTVQAIWKDLVLLSRRFGNNNVDGERYYICNARTMHSKDDLVSLPPIHPCSWSCHPAVGFICEPYYAEVEEDDQNGGGKRRVIKIDAEYKFKVVRIPDPNKCYSRLACFEFKIQVFSNDIGEWRESVVSCPRGFFYSKLGGNRGGFASNGMLYWLARDGCLLGLGPMINNSTTATTAIGDYSRYQFHVIKLSSEANPADEYLPRSSQYHLHMGHLGRLQLVRLVVNDDLYGTCLYVWELEKQEQVQMVVQGGGKLRKRHRKIYPILDGEWYTDLQYYGSDPNDLATCFVSLTDDTKKMKIYNEDEDECYYEFYKVIYKCNIYTGEYSKMMDDNFCGNPLQIMVPWWPTPAPTIRSRKAGTSVSK